MSLQSCMACGHALAIADHRCRHCSPPMPEAQRGVKGMAFYLFVALGGVLLAFLIYNLLLR